MLLRGDYDEKRDFARMGIECPVIFRVEGDDSLYHGVASDLSATGLQITCTTEVSLGTQGSVELRPDKAIVPPLNARVEVMRCRELGAGSFELGLKIVEMLPS